MTDFKRTNFYLPVRQLDILDKIARTSGLSRSEVLRRAIDYYALVATSAKYPAKYLESNVS